MVPEHAVGSRAVPPTRGVWLSEPASGSVLRAHVDKAANQPMKPMVLCGRSPDPQYAKASDIGCEFFKMRMALSFGAATHLGPPWLVMLRNGIAFVNPSSAKQMFFKHELQLMRHHDVSIDGAAAAEAAETADHGAAAADAVDEADAAAGASCNNSLYSWPIEQLLFHGGP
jgi:hypothetical protein